MTGHRHATTVAPNHTEDQNAGFGEPCAGPPELPLGVAASVCSAGPGSRAPTSIVTQLSGGAREHSRELGHSVGPTAGTAQPQAEGPSPPEVLSAQLRSSLRYLGGQLLFSGSALVVVGSTWLLHAAARFCCSARSGTAMDLGLDYCRVLLALGFVSSWVLHTKIGMAGRGSLG